ncbi:MAG: hypothetical protein HYT16_04640 [DPANN group archaeon]|nr:hypothetical protein [DPANN group archaeon]
MGDPTKLVLGELVNDLLSQGRVLRDMARQDLVGCLIEAEVFFGDAKTYEASGRIEHIILNMIGDNGVEKPASALITFRGRAAVPAEDDKERLHQIRIGADADEFRRGYRLNFSIYSN